MINVENCTSKTETIHGNDVSVHGRNIVVIKEEEVYNYLEQVKWIKEKQSKASLAKNYIHTLYTVAKTDLNPKSITKAINISAVASFTYVWSHTMDQY